MWKPGLVEYESFTASFSDTEALRHMDRAVCHLAVVQNCLNEVPDDAQSKVVHNILEVFRRLSPGAEAGPSLWLRPASGQAALAGWGY